MHILKFINIIWLIIFGVQDFFNLKINLNIFAIFIVHILLTNPTGIIKIIIGFCIYFIFDGILTDTIGIYDIPLTMFYIDNLSQLVRFFKTLVLILSFYNTPKLFGGIPLITVLMISLISIIIRVPNTLI